MISFLRLLLVYHYCSIRQEFVQERIVVNNNPYSQSYECGACSEMLILSDTTKSEGKVVNMDWYEIGQWKARDGGEYRRISTQIPLPWVGGA